MFFNLAATIRLILPELEKKAHIVFSVEPGTPPPPGTPTPPNTTGSQVEIPAQQANQQVSVAEERHFTADLQYFIKPTVKGNFVFRTMAQFSNERPVWYGALRYRVLLPLDDS